MFLSNEVLTTMLNLKRSTSESRTTSGHIFYIRTFTFTFSKLLELLQALFDQGVGIFEQPLGWLELLFSLDPVRDANTVIYIRYLGTSSSTTAWGRFKDDLKMAERTIGSFIYRFLHLCTRDHPQIIADTEVHELPDGLIPMELNRSRQRIADVREQALIALFGHRYVLNTSEGGYGRRYQYSDTDAHDFAVLRTDTLRNIRSYTEPFQDIALLDTYARAVQEYAAENPVSTKQRLYPITDDLCATIRRQATPVMIRGTKYSVMVTIGSDNTAEGCASKNAFYKGVGQSSEVTIDIFNNLAQCEQGYSTTATNFVSEMCDDSQLPFVDVFPWAGKMDVDLPFALKNLRSYLKATSPLIVLTFSNNVSKIAMSSFHRLKYFRVQTYGMVDIIGKPVISKYDENQRDADDDNCCIVIPCLHPGSVAHANVGGKVMLKLIWRTLAVAWFAMNESLKLFQRTGPVLTKREILLQLIEIVNEKTGPGSRFGKNFEKKREALRKYYTILWAGLSRRTRVRIQGDIPVIQTKSIRWRKALEELYSIMKCDFARGNSNSEERKDQTERLFHHYAYMVRSPQTGATDDEFRLWCRNVPRNEPFYFAACSSFDALDDITNLLSIFVPTSSDADSDDWENDANIVDHCYKELQAWSAKSLVKTGTSLDDTIRNIPRAFKLLLESKEREFAAVMRNIIRSAAEIPETFVEDGQEVAIRAGRNFGARPQMVLKWDHDGTEHELQDLSLPLECQPIIDGEVRTLHL